MSGVIGNATRITACVWDCRLRTPGTTPVTLTADTSGHLVLSYLRNLAADDVSIDIETSEDLEIFVQALESTFQELDS